MKPDESLPEIKIPEMLKSLFVIVSPAFASVLAVASAVFLTLVLILANSPNPA